MTPDPHTTPDFDDPTDPSSAWAKEHLDAYVATDGETGHEWRPGVPTLLLTTIGQRSGKARRTPLIYGRDGSSYVIVASKGGADVAPLWYSNLQAQPLVRVQVGAQVMDARAHTATAEEKARLWPTMAAIWPAYDDYQRRTERDIPVVVIEPTAAVG
jgi:deazaflavin-dependent oxidoreductase (nitroreductase family)